MLILDCSEEPQCRMGGIGMLKDLVNSEEIVHTKLNPTVFDEEAIIGILNGLGIPTKYIKSIKIDKSDQLQNLGKEVACMAEVSDVPSCYVIDTLSALTSQSGNGMKAGFEETGISKHHSIYSFNVTNFDPDTTQRYNISVALKGKKGWMEKIERASNNAELLREMLPGNSVDEALEKVRYNNLANNATKPNYQPAH